MPLSKRIYRTVSCRAPEVRYADEVLKTGEKCGGVLGVLLETLAVDLLQKIAFDYFSSFVQYALEPVRVH